MDYSKLLQQSNILTARQPLMQSTTSRYTSNFTNTAA